jgi:hypothetical protein
MCPHTVLETWDKSVKKIKIPLSHGVYILVGDADNE